MPSYTVETERFGTLTIVADNIAAARKKARQAFKVRRPGDVRPVKAYVYCSRCASAPCCCDGGR